MSNSSRVSRINTQRKGTAGKPVLCWMAVSETTSIVRSFLPYQLATVIGFQSVLGSSATAERFAMHSPLRRGRLIWPERRPVEYE